MNITIRDTDGHVVADGPACETIARRSRHVDVKRVDIYVSQDEQALLAVEWLDEAHGTCDWTDSRACLDWIRLQPWARGLTRVHFPRRSAQHGRA